MYTFREKYRNERSSELAAACSIAHASVSVVLYDLALRRRYAAAASFGAVTSQSVSEELARLTGLMLSEFGIAAEAVKRVGIAAPFAVESFMEQTLSAESLGLESGTDIFFVPFISARVGGCFTASLLTLPKGDCVAADFGRTFYAARIKGDIINCAAFDLRGAFDGSGLENGMPAEKGAIETVRRENDGTIAYEVIGDGVSAGISPCAAAMSVVIMRRMGVLDDDGIMTDRDLFHIGEDFFVSQSDIRVLQSDKAMAAAVLELFSDNAGGAFFSGEIFSHSAGLKSLIELGVVQGMYSKAAFCRNSVQQGIILCLESDEELNRARQIAENARDITDELLPEADKLYYGNLMFFDGKRR